VNQFNLPERVDELIDRFERDHRRHCRPRAVVCCWRWQSVRRDLGNLVVTPRRLRALVGEIVSHETHDVTLVS
jgi:hypothetical protein